MGKRIEWADYAKAIGIILMLLGHNELANERFFDWIYTFHMPLFFVLTGYFTASKSVTFPQHVKKNARQLLVPYVFYYLLSLPFGLFVIYSHRYNHPFDGPLEFIGKPLLGLFFVKTTDISFHTNGPTWFFVALFISKSLFWINSRFKYSNKSLIISTILILCIYIIFQHVNIENYCRFKTALLGYLFITIGYLLRRYSIFDYVGKLNGESKLVLSAFCFSMCWLGVMINGHVEFSAANYGNNILIMYICGVSGTVGTVVLSQLLPTSKILLCIGANTGIILGLHSMIQTSIRYVLNILCSVPLSDYSLYMAIPVVCLTLAVLYPIIIFLNKYTPKFVGK